MQLLLIRHALPHRSEHGQGSDPELSEVGHEQARRLPAALRRFPVSRLVSSPQRRAVQTAGPVAAELGLGVDIEDRLAEYDRDMAGYVPIEHLRTERPQDWARMADGHLPGGVDETAFGARIGAAVADIVAAADHEDTVAVFGHGGVINMLLHEILGTRRPLSFPIDYASVTRLLYSRSGKATVVSTNGTEHVWDLLPRNQRR
ncbi:MAG: histidine phosphatase family protein [Mycobacterium sp.]|nr:histidine phosphatase family protein [Mycobacterium sp.]